MLDTFFVHFFAVVLHNYVLKLPVRSYSNTFYRVNVPCVSVCSPYHISLVESVFPSREQFLTVCVALSEKTHVVFPV